MTNRLAQFTPALILAAGVLVVSGIREQYAMTLRAPIASLPTNFGGNTSRDIVVGEEERKIAGMSEYVMREFRRDSTTMFSVYVGYYDRQVQGKTIHSPKNCLPGAGWEILTSARAPMPGGLPGETVNRVLLANRGVQALVVYWYQGRGRVASNEYSVKWDLLRDAAIYGRTDEALVRIVVPIEPPVRALADSTSQRLAHARAVATADSIANMVIPELSRDVARVLPAPPKS